MPADACTLQTTSGSTAGAKFRTGRNYEHEKLRKFEATQPDTAEQRYKRWNRCPRQPRSLKCKGPQHGVNLVLLLEAREVMGTVREIGHRDDTDGDVDAVVDDGDDAAAVVVDADYDADGAEGDAVGDDETHRQHQQQCMIFRCVIVCFLK